MTDRNLVGYGTNLPQVRWPADARIAASVVVNYEEGSEYSILDGDSHRETNGEVPSPMPMDTRDLLNKSMFEYGSRVEVWRLLRLFDKYDIKSTFFCCALAVERNPAVGKEIVLRGQAHLRTRPLNELDGRPATDHRGLVGITSFAPYSSGEAAMGFLLN